MDQQSGNSVPVSEHGIAVTVRKKAKHKHGKPVQVAVVVDPVKSAKMAGLHYVSDRDPGIHRKRAGRGFSYIGLDGKPIKDRQILNRIRALAIPPAWETVWISPIPEGHLQATGRDARGRKQYIYHRHWRTVRDQNKFNRMVPFGNALPLIRKHTEDGLALPGLAREKVLATVVRLLETSLIRVGNEEYAKENSSFGLTTMRTRHLEVCGATMRFRFRGNQVKSTMWKYMTGAWPK